MWAEKTGTFAVVTFLKIVYTERLTFQVFSYIKSQQKTLNKIMLRICSGRWV